MKLSLSNKKPAVTQDACIIRFFTSEQVKSVREKLGSEGTPFAVTVRNKVFTGEKGKTMSLFGMDETDTLVIAGLGDEKKITTAFLRNLSGSAMREAKKNQKKKILVEMPAIAGIPEEKILRSLSEGFLLADYEYLRKSKPDKKPRPEEILIYGASEQNRSVIEESVKVSEAVNYTRELINENAEKITTVELGNEALKIARQYKLKATLIDEKQLKKQGFGLITAVGQGAANPPRIVTLEYKNGGAKGKTIALIGKGICFDSGGLNLKPSGYLEDMRHDMAGAASVLGTMKAIASLKLKINVIGVMAIAENAIGSRAYKPGDIFTAYNGKTVEVLNTDAEGRLVLADALSYTEEKFKPDYIVDIATLTGAVVIALGDQYAGLMSQDKELEEALLKASQETDERIWPLPLTEPYMDEMKSDIADLKNIGEGRNAGTIRGAAFLSAFIKNTKWAHLDIAGVSWNHKKQGAEPKYASGFGVRLFVNLCSKI